MLRRDSDSSAFALCSHPAGFIHRRFVIYQLTERIISDCYHDCCHAHVFTRGGRQIHDYGRSSGVRFISRAARITSDASWCNLYALKGPCADCACGSARSPGWGGLPPVDRRVLSISRISRDCDFCSSASRDISVLR